VSRIERALELWIADQKPTPIGNRTGWGRNWGEVEELDVTSQICEAVVMLLVGKGEIDNACKKHPDWCPNLGRRVKLTEAAEWKNFAEVRQTFGSASSVGEYVIFDIAGNKARLVTIIAYKEKLVAVEGVLSHAEYDKRNFK
jgi:mRNA interferase HigB